LAISALAAACLLLAFSGMLAAEPNEDDGASGATASISPAADVDPDREGPMPSAFQPVMIKALTPADLPPPSVFAALSGLRGASVIFGRDWRAGRNEYRAIVEREAHAYEMPPALLDAVMAVESGYNPAIIGMDGEIGLMQVMPATARMLGFTGTQAQLADPQINIHYGAKYLAGAWRLAGQDLCTAAMKYRAGHGETRFSFRSVDYCLRVRRHLTARGLAVSGTVPQPSFGAPSGADGGRRSRSSLAVGRALNFAALNANLRALTGRIALHKVP
jgi:soluble lytic murein transglycosylase-like protein